MLGKDRQAVGANFGKAAANKHPAASTRDLGIEHAGPQRGDDRRMTGQHRELPFHSGHDHLLGVLRE